MAQRCKKVQVWKENGRADWAYLPAYDSERFIEHIRRAKLKARVVVKFIQDVFRGREKVSKQDLFGIAAMHGFASRRRSRRGMITSRTCWINARELRQ